MQHVDEGRIHAWLDGELPEAGPGGADELERHLAECAACRALVEEERRFRDGASAILRGADPGEVAAPRTLPAPASGVPRRDAGRRWVAVGWAASVMLALGIGWMARPAQREPVAIDTPRGAEPHGTSAPSAAPPPPAAVDPAPADEAERRVAPPVTDAPAPTPAPPPADPATPADPAATTRRPVELPAPSDPAPFSDAAVVLPRSPVRSAPVPPAAPPPPAVSAEPAAPAPALKRAAHEARMLKARAAVARTEDAARREMALAAPPPPEVTVRGRVTDMEGQALAGAQVSIPGTGRRVVTDRDGGYALALPDTQLAGSDSVRVRVDRLGYDARTRTLLPRPEGVARLDFALPSSSISLDALVVTGAGAATEEVAWREVARAEAERRLGRRLVAVPQLPLLGVEIGKVEGRAAVRVRQQREDGTVLSLVQHRAPRARSRQREELERAIEERGGWLVVLEEEELVVEASEPVPADSLRLLPALPRRP